MTVVHNHNVYLYIIAYLNILYSRKLFIYSTKQYCLCEVLKLCWIRFWNINLITCNLMAGIWRNNAIMYKIKIFSLT